MNFRDTLVTCRECGKRFVFTVEAQRRLAERGQEIVVPQVCDTCARKARYGGKLHGRVKWFSREKGYGFIIEDDGNEIFFHRKGVPLTAGGTLPLLDDGQEVLYETMDTPKGPQAVQVTPLD